jgi:hypothetical protein
MSIHSTPAEPGAEWAEHQCELLGLRPDHPHYADALNLTASMFASQIADRMGAPREFVRRLGGPRERP